jgi:manganese-dependent ADP-ribose/CDP-alcohol diphosphatase
MMRIILILLVTQLFTTSLSMKNHSASSNTELCQDKKPLFSFGIIADVQYCDCEKYGTRFYRNSIEKLTTAIDEIAKESPSFIINLGDLIDRDYGSFPAVMKVFESFTKPVYHAIGNHDYSVDGSAAGKIVKITNSKQGYYSFVHEGFRFVVLNGNDVATYAVGADGRKEAQKRIAELKAEGALNAYDWNGGIGSRQLIWLESELKSSAEAGQKVFLVCHFPAWPAGSHNLLNSNEVLKMIGNYDHIIAWLNGHNHDGGYGNYSMIHFVTFRGMVETADINSFAMVEVYSDKLWIKGYGREKSQILAY